MALLSSLSPAANVLTTLRNTLISPTGFLLGGLLLAMVVLSQLGHRSPKLARSYLGGSRELGTARRRAYRQRLAARANAVSLWINGHAKPPRSPWTQGLLQLLDPDGALYLSDAQRGILVLGGPGSGKTYSAIDPLVRSALRQGFPTLVFDFKYPSQTQRHLPLAVQHGYDIHLFAPGFPESECFNPLDFIHDGEDMATARQIAEVLSRNLKPHLSTTEDPFFTPAGDQLTAAALLLAANTPFPDLLTAQTILSQPELAQRLQSAHWINPWVRKGFDQFLASAGSDKTMASIASTAALNFSHFIDKSLLPNLLGSSIPTELTGQQFLVLGMDRQRQKAIQPILAILLDLLITRNLAIPRSSPLAVFLDELPTLKLPRLAEWINTTGREAGLIPVLGIQNLAQLEYAYGREQAKAIVGGCATKLIFNPQDPESARTFSELLGEEEISLPSRSTSRGKGGQSHTTSQQERTRKVVEPSQLARMKTGTAILISPGFANHHEEGVALKRRLRVPSSDVALAQSGIQKWPQVCQTLARSYSLPPEAIGQRQSAVEQLLGESPSSLSPSAPGGPPKPRFLADAIRDLKSQGHPRTFQQIEATIRQILTGGIDHVD